MKSHPIPFAVMLVLSGCAMPAGEAEASRVESALGVLHVDAFTRGVSAGGWTISGPSGDAIAEGGGNPGAYLRDASLVAPAPTAQTTGSSVFTGDYRAPRVESLSIDLIVHAWALPPVDRRNVHLVLWSDPGTPRDASDDVAVWTDSGDPIPRTPGAWESYAVTVPSRATSLPPGWTAYRPGTVVAGAEADAIWSRVMRGVSRVAWSWGPPLSANAVSAIDSGIDNAAITRGGDALAGGALE